MPDAVRVETASAFLERARKDPGIKPATRFEWFVFFCGRYQNRMDQDQIWQMMRKAEIPAEASENSIFQYAGLLADLAVKRTMHWLCEPTDAGYAEAVTILDQAMPRVSQNHQYDLKFRKCIALLHLKKYAEADSLAQECLKQEKLPLRTKAALTAIRAESLTARENYAEAFALYQTIDPKEMRPYNLQAAETAMALEKYQDAAVLLEQHIKNTSRGERYFGAKLSHVKKLAEEQKQTQK